ncbi:hypothetical protein AB0K52_15345 [Glycomyces sp. NPDC049804]|uniref:hypothetical protein n=1 Tax=Glycomyces sp. NPDC049804 TaxID=3154363 RepID=UPI00341AE362
MAVLIGITAVLAWLGGIFLVMARGYLLPAIRTEEFRLEVAAERGWFDGIETPTIQPGSAADPDALAGLMHSGEEVGKRKQGIVKNAWENDPEYKEEVRRRWREYYVKYHAEYSLFVGGAWALTFILVEPLRQALVLDGLEILTPVYALVVPLWIAVALIATLEALKSAQRRARKNRH